MATFSKKKLKPSKRVCLRLKEARVAANMTLTELSRRTKLSKKYLKALEECRFEEIPCAVIYKKNFIKRYAAALDINQETLVKQFVDEEVVKKEEEIKTVDTVSKSRMYNIPIIFRHVGIVAILVVCVGYLGLQVRRIVEPPKLNVYAPQNGQVTEKQMLVVYGDVEREAQVEINGESIMKNDSGQFKEEVTLSPGINTITVTAKKKHGKTTNETRHVILKQTHQFSLGERTEEAI